MFVFMRLVYHGDFREPGEARADRTTSERAQLQHVWFRSRAKRAAWCRGINGVSVEMRAN